MEEVPAAHVRHERSIGPILESEPPGDEEAVQMPFPVVMPAGGRSARHPGLGHGNTLRIERFLAGDSQRRVPCMKIGLVDDFNSRQPPRDSRALE